MGIKGLTKLLADNAPRAMKEQRYVFDGQPPDLKKQELAKRFSKREDATKDLSAAIEAGDRDGIDKFSKRTVKNILPQWHDGVLLNDGNYCEDKAARNIYVLDCVECNHKNYSAIGGNELGSFYLLASRDENISGKGFKYWWGGRASHHPKCWHLLKQKRSVLHFAKVYAVASEDMDSLTFGAPRFLRHLMDPSSKKIPVVEFEVSKVLEELELTMDQFIDLCILCGCDYCNSIKAVFEQMLFSFIGGFLPCKGIACERNCVIMLSMHAFEIGIGGQTALKLIYEIGGHSLSVNGFRLLSVESQPHMQENAGDRDGIDKFSKRTVKNILPQWHDGVLLNDGNYCEDKAARNIYVLDCVECNHKNYSAIGGNELGSFYLLASRDENISGKGFKYWWGGRASHHPKCWHLLKQKRSVLHFAKVYAVASEDMDSLTFGAPRFLRHLMDPSSKKIPVVEFEVSKVLEELELTMDQFIDLCILCGCDYCNSIKGELEGKCNHPNILWGWGYQIPEDWPYQEARRLFKEPIVSQEFPELKWTAPDEEGLVDFLVKDNGFNHDRVKKALGFEFDDDEFHAYVHGRLPYEILKPDPFLRGLLLSMPQRKMIFTNADKAHAEQVLKRQGLEDCFEGVICFETLNPPVLPSDGDEKINTNRSDAFEDQTLSQPKESKTKSESHTDSSRADGSSRILCKPSIEAIKTAIQIAKIDPQKTIFFDDSARNIAAGKAAGLTTVIVGSSELVPGADHALGSIHNIKEALPEIWEGWDRLDPVLPSTAVETVVLA
ncbi:hypothetical protein COCNU_scaffold015291G000020 [Cocos nucifera]|nr:hypothetical protein [Cocos nucifera]